MSARGSLLANKTTFARFEIGGARKEREREKDILRDPDDHRGSDNGALLLLALSATASRAVSKVTRVTIGSSVGRATCLAKDAALTVNGGDNCPGGYPRLQINKPN